MKASLEQSINRRIWWNLAPPRGASAVQDAITPHVLVGIQNGQQHRVRNSEIDKDGYLSLLETV